MKYFSGKEKLCSVFCSVFATPQRTHKSRHRFTPIAAADSGCRLSETSTHAQTFPASVICATKESAREVRPEHSGPTISLMAPIGNPPRSNSSRPSMPVAAVSRMILGAGVSAEGIRSARPASTWRRIAATEAMTIFALYSPNVRYRCQTRLAPQPRQFGAKFMKSRAGFYFGEGPWVRSGAPLVIPDHGTSSAQASRPTGLASGYRRSSQRPNLSRWRMGSPQI